MFLLVVAWCSLIAGCASSMPKAKPEVHAYAPVVAPLWSEVKALRSDDWVHLLNSGEEAIEWRLRAIDCATQGIDLQTFLWENEAIGLVVLRHLFAAADRGVRVRLLLDDTFTATHAEELWHIDHHPNIELRIYNPFRRRAKGMFVRQLMNLGDFRRLDHRMHNKALIVDNRAAIVGGRNLADEYFGAHEEANFRDMEVLLGGPQVTSLSDLFDEFWNNDWTMLEDQLQKNPKGEQTPQAIAEWVKASTSKGLEEGAAERSRAWLEMVKDAISVEVRLLADDPAPEDPADLDEQPTQLWEDLRMLFDEAEEELILVSAYLIPTPELEQTIERTEARGVSVRILTNSLRSNNHVAAHSVYRKHIHRLISHGADLHEVRAEAKDRHVYMRSPIASKELGLHAKLAIIDDSLTLIGSANLDPRSLRLNTEMALLLRSKELNRRVRRLLDLDFHGRNAWHLQSRPDGTIHWVADDQTLTKQPAESAYQRLEDWFLGTLPIEGEM